MTNHEPDDQLIRRIARVIASARALLTRPDPDGRAAVTVVHTQLVQTYLRCLEAVRDELDALGGDPAGARRLIEVTSAQADSVDYANHLMRLGRPRTAASFLAEAVWDAVREHYVPQTTELAYVLRHAVRLFNDGLCVLEEYFDRLAALVPTPEELTRLNTAGFGAFREQPAELIPAGDSLPPDFTQKILDRLKANDVFSSARTFRPLPRGILSGPTAAIRSLENFYGYRKERTFLHEYFSAFARNESLRPLLLSGLPGMGKTHLTIASVLAAPELILINAEHQYLEEPLEGLVDTLRAYHYRRFVIFFDDVDPEKVDWATFRNQVDGYLPYADNVAMVIATNSEFPARVRSRCTAYEFRPMNPEVCEEFVSDYLEEHRWMSQPYPNLVSTVAADYATMFKRKVLSELTPRSLIRYFEMLENDKEKIRKLIRESLEDVVRLPPEQAFIESNRHVIERLERERRGELGVSPESREPAPRTHFGGRELPREGPQ